MKLLDAIVSTETGRHYLSDRAFRGSVGIYQGMAANFAYAAFRMAEGIVRMSAWFITSAVYFALLGAMRACLAYAYRRRVRRGGLIYEHRCCRRTGGLLLLLTVPMGTMIVILIRAETGSAYPGYTIYASAAYTFYMATLSIVNLFKYRRLGSPILSAAKTLTFAAAMMSMLCLQNALIAAFSGGDAAFRVLMNTLTGTGVYLIVIAAAVCMIVRASRAIKEGTEHEPLGEQVLQHRRPHGRGADVPAGTKGL